MRGIKMFNKKILFISIIFISTAFMFTNIFSMDNEYTDNFRRTEDLKCCICDESITNETNNTTLRCTYKPHTFHTKCITKWLMQKQNCPCCITTITSQDTQDIILKMLQQEFNIQTLLTEIKKIEQKNLNNAIFRLHKEITHIIMETKKILFPSIDKNYMGYEKLDDKNKNNIMNNFLKQLYDLQTNLHNQQQNILQKDQEYRSSYIIENLKKQDKQEPEMLPDIITLQFLDRKKLIGFKSLFG